MMDLPAFKVVIIQEEDFITKGFFLDGKLNIIFGYYEEGEEPKTPEEIEHERNKAIGNLIALGIIQTEETRAAARDADSRCLAQLQRNQVARNASWMAAGNSNVC